MFRIMFSKAYAKGKWKRYACGVKTEHGAVVWSTLIGNRDVEHFVAKINKCGVQEDELFEVVGEFIAHCWGTDGVKRESKKKRH